MKLYWFNKLCCVPGCFNSSTEGAGCFKEYFDLPAEPHARAKWLKSILAKDGDNLKVCEDHFKIEDIFSDKNNRKKLRLNSVPSRNLPKFICINCLGSKIPLPEAAEESANFQIKLCQCEPSFSVLQPVQSSLEKSSRNRITWTFREKCTLFKAIRAYGDVKFTNNKILINWNKVIKYYRAKGCFGNDKELKIVWQNMRANATKVYKNELYGTKLDRKVSKFLYGKTKKVKNKKPKVEIAQGSAENKDENIQNLNDRINIEEIVVNNNEVMTEIHIKENDELVDEESDDEYYSLTDVEEIFQIKIRPDPQEIIDDNTQDDE